MQIHLNAAISQQGLEKNLKYNFLTMFLGFQKLSSTLHLIVVKCLLTVPNNCFYHFKFYPHKKKFEEIKKKTGLIIQINFCIFSSFSKIILCCLFYCKSTMRYYDMCPETQVIG